MEGSDWAVRAFCSMIIAMDPADSARARRSIAFAASYPRHRFEPITPAYAIIEPGIKLGKTASMTDVVILAIRPNMASNA